MPSSPLMLSVSGLRGIIGGSLTPPVASQFAAALGGWLRDRKSDQSSPHIVIGRDSRPSGAMIEMAATASLLAIGCRVTNLGIVSTPGVAIMVEHLGADGGLVITASHNPVVWNGMKPLLRIGTHKRIQAPPVKEASEIIARFHEGAPAYVDVHHLMAPAHDRTGPRVHCNKVLEHIDAAPIRARKLKVVVDGVHGAAGEETAMLLEALGVERVHLYAQPTGAFPHAPEPTRENLTSLCEAVRLHQADIGFAQDPDGDRLAMVDERGVYLGEEYTLALACLRLLDRAAEQNKARGVQLVTNLSTSRMIDDVAQRAGATVVRTPVGEANVAAAMQHVKALAGGEGNGGVIFPPVTLVRDSLIGMALVLELLAARDLSLSAVVREVPGYAIVKDKTQANDELIARIGPALSQAYARQTIDTQDGVRVDWPDRWVHVRPSNTEPIIRFIAEAASESAATQLIQDVRRTLGVA